jgi:hypothetical protein
MKRRTSAGILLIVIAMLFIGVVAEGSSELMEIHIDVAPKTLNLESNGNGVTVHTNIAYSSVDCNTVTMKVEGVEIYECSCYSDDCGDLVVKVNREDVVYAIGYPDVSPTNATFTLSGSTATGLFTGTDTIDVIDVAQNGSKK